jgi:NADPH-dependent 2,4-dienoyl-CoA reductase/sulfur reductase-like enzyme/peroxiredoxin family protein/TusA-related sulfurtransferase/rhodanese-related sulfurtransferase
MEFFFIARLKCIHIHIIQLRERFYRSIHYFHLQLQSWVCVQRLVRQQLFLQLMHQMAIRAAVQRAILRQHSRNFTVATSQSPRIVMIGGVAGGATGAARARRLAEHAQITIVERGTDVSFANCGLPYHIGNDIKERSKLVLHTPSSLGGLLGINVMPQTTATAIDRKNQRVSITDAAGKVSTLDYDKLLISTGAAPRRPPFPGVEAPGVFVLRTMQDMDGIMSRVGPGKTAVVIGAGFIGLEMVEALHNRGMKVILIEAQKHVLPVMDTEMTGSLLTEMQQRGVDVRCSEKTVKIVADGLNHQCVHLDSGAVIRSDLVLLSAGVQAESGLALAAGIECDARNKTILVNKHMQTSDPNVYAVGDVVSTPSAILPEHRLWVPLGGPANRQARLAADHMILGEAADAYRGSLGTAIVRAFEASAGLTGFTERQLADLKVPFDTSVVSGYDHASYYPGAQPLTLKVLWHKESGKLLGAQAFGGSNGVDKRLDVLATCLLTKATIDDLAHLELSYAPPFGSARDIVNTVGFVGQNMRRELILPVREIPTDRACTVVDVRDADSAALHPVAVPAGSKVINVPLEEMRGRMEQLKHAVEGTEVVTACNLGKLSYFGARILSQNGVPTKSLQGGVRLQPTNDAPKGTAIPPAAPVQAAAATAAPVAAAAIEVDACGLACPGPILALRKVMDQLGPGQQLKVRASDPGFYNDFQAFCRANQLTVVDVSKKDGVITGVCTKQNAPESAQIVQADPNKKDVSIVVFSGDMDKVLAALVIANGAVAMGGKATMFFTFWGLSALRTSSAAPAEHHAPNKMLELTDKMMRTMLPKDMNHLSLSSMNFGGLGGPMMSTVMQLKGLPTLPKLMKEAQESGKVRIVACTMSMDALGLTANDLLPKVELGGVAEFLSAASESRTSLFI